MHISRHKQPLLISDTSLYRVVPSHFKFTYFVNNTHFLRNSSRRYGKNTQVIIGLILKIELWSKPLHVDNKDT